MDSDRDIIVLIAILAVSTTGLFTSLQMPSITGEATSASTISSAVIQKYFSINISGNLSDGIDFGIITQLPANNWNATKNWNYTGGGDVWHNETLYWITVEMDSNTPVDLCIITDALNTSGGDEIGIGNYTFANNQTNNMTWPGVIDQFTMNTTNYTASDWNIPVGENSYFRFWLDVPASTASGTYNNTVTFLGRPTGTACPY